MKSGAIWVHCLGLALADFGCNLHSSNSFRSTSWWKLSEENFENFTIRGRISPKCKNFSQYFNVLRLQTVITMQRLRIAVNSLPNDPSMECLVSIFIVIINSKWYPWAVRSVQETYQIFGNVQYWANQVHRGAAWLTDMEEKQTWTGNWK